MKRFDPTAIKNRTLKRLRPNVEWAILSEDGTISNVITALCENFAEIARYGEFLLGEKKWKTALNLSSLTTMGGLISRKQRRPRSASGFVVVSHTDATGANRLSNLGKYFFGIDDASDYDNLTKNASASVTAQKTLVPWTCDDVYAVPKGTRFLTGSSTEFIATESVQSRVLKERWSDIAADDDKLKSFYQAGGWNGIKYVKVPVIQGTVMTVELGKVASSKFETFCLNVPDIEDASNSISSQYLKFIVTLSTGKTEEWSNIQSILLASPYDKVFETKQLPDGSGTLFKVGNGITGKMLPEGSSVSVQYLQTSGAAGNIDKKFQITKIIFPDGEQMIDPRTNTVSAFLSCTNVVPILGGYDAEDEEEYRENAPTSYLQSFAIATRDAYTKQIKNYSPVSLLKIRAFPDADFSTSSLSTTAEDEDVINELSTIKNTLKVTAILANGEKIENATESFINPVIKSLADLKGPNDSLEYIEPNYIQLRAGLKVKTDNLNITDDEVKDNVKTAVSDVYSIYNTDFKESLRSSKIIQTAKTFPFATSVSLLLEAMAETKYDINSVKLVKTASNNVELAYIPFKFDKVFGYNQYKKGFKNYKVNSPYILKVNLEFINDAVKASTKNRTFFLFDERNRMGSTDGVTLEAAKSASGLKIFQKDSVSADSAIGRVTFYEEERENFNDRYVRVAQYPFISAITDDAYMTKARSFSKEPYEIRPYKVDSTGKNQIFLSANVATSLQVAISSDSSVCYQADNRFINYVEVIFNENYDDYTSDDFCSGAIILPLSYFGFSTQLAGYTSAQDKEKLAAFTTLLKDFVKISVYAVPLIDDIETDNINDIIFIDDDDIIVEKEKIYDL
jgi:hypothetical protein